MTRVPLPAKARAFRAHIFLRHNNLHHRVAFNAAESKRIKKDIPHWRVRIAPFALHQLRTLSTNECSISHRRMQSNMCRKRDTNRAHKFATVSKFFPCRNIILRVRRVQALAHGDSNTACRDCQAVHILAGRRHSNGRPCTLGYPRYEPKASLPATLAKDLPIQAAK